MAVGALFWLVVGVVVPIFIIALTLVFADSWLNDFWKFVRLPAASRKSVLCSAFSFLLNSLYLINQLQINRISRPSGGLVFKKARVPFAPTKPTRPLGRISGTKWRSTMDPHAALVTFLWYTIPNFFCLAGSTGRVGSMVSRKTLFSEDSFAPMKMLKLLIFFLCRKHHHKTCMNLIFQRPDGARFKPKVLCRLLALALHGQKTIASFTFKVVTTE